MNLSKFDLTNKHVLVTGAAGVLGKEHVKALLDVGANVVMTDINIGSLENALDEISVTHDITRAYIHKMDVTIKSEIQEFKEFIINNNQRIDILINNAAIDPKVNLDSLVNLSRFENLELDDWNQQLMVGLTGAFLCSQIFGSAMANDGKGGVILNIASDLSVISPDQRIYMNESLPESRQPVKPVTYSVTKSGLVGLTKYLSTYWLGKNVRCNSLSPGGVYTNQNSAFVNKISTLIPLGRMAKLDEYHSIVQFLCSDASSYMTGQNIIVDGGRSVW